MEAKSRESKREGSEPPMTADGSNILGLMAKKISEMSDGALSIGTLHDALNGKRISFRAVEAISAVLGCPTKLLIKTAKHQRVTSVLANGREIRSLRSRARLSIVKAQEILSNPEEYDSIDETTWKNAEKGERVSFKTIKLILKVFNSEDVRKALGLRDGERIELEQITRRPNEFRWPLMKEALDSATGQLGKEGGLLSNLVHGLEPPTDVDPAISEVEALLTLAIRRDVLGESRRALALGQLLLREEWIERHEDSTVRDLAVRIRVRTATFYDHAGMPKPGSRLLDQILDKKGEVARERYYWALYQKGVLLLKV